MEAEAGTENRPTLAQALRSTFDPLQSADSFARDLARLAAALSTASEVLVLAAKDGSVLAATPQEAQLSAQLSELILAQPSNAGEPQQEQDALFIPIALPGGGDARLVGRMKSAGATTRALAFERFVSLAQMSAAMYRHPDISHLETLLSKLNTPDADPSALASSIRGYVDADLVAVAAIENGAIINVALSDQPKPTRRATLPEQIEKDLLAAANGTGSAEGVYAASREGRAMALKVETPRRNTGVLPLLAQAALAGQGSDVGLGAKRRKGLMRLGAGLLIGLGICVIPLPDTRRVPGEIIAVEARTVTAPLSGIVLSVSVSDGDAVTGGESELARIATNEIAQELASAQAEYSRALLEREGARGARDASALRNAELEAEGLRARIDLLEGRRARALITAPIDGVVVGDDLSTFLGATVRQGDPLLEVVDPSNLALRLEVPDDLLLRIEDGEAGVFRPDFAPNQQFDGTVISISPAQSARTDIAVFEGRASLPADTGQLRPGLRGVFVFDREYRMLAQIVYQAMRDWILLRVWL
jgi:biotin carboxyl carrier protein